MSTKTTFKRIALATVAALGFGMLSVAPSSATIVSSEYVSTGTTVDGAAVVLGTNATLGLAAADAVSQITSPVGKSIIFMVKGSSASPVYAVTDVHQLIVNGQLISSTLGVATATNVLAAYVAPAAGTYTVMIRSYITATITSAATSVLENTLTLTVVGVNTVSTDFGLTNNTTDSVGASTAGIFVSAVAASVTQSSGRVGVPVGFVPTMTLKRNKGVTTDAGDLSALYANVRYSVTNPAGTAVTVVTAIGGTTASTNQYIAGPTAFVNASATAATTKLPAPGSSVYFVPATAGTYTITAWHDQDRDTLQDAYEAVAATTVVVAADALPSIAFTKYGSSTTGQAAATKFGQLVKITLANGVTPFALSPVESLVLTGVAGTVFDMKSVMAADGTFAMADATNNTTVTLTSVNFNALGNAYVNVGVVTGADGGTSTVTAAIVGGTASGASGAFTLTTVDTTTYAQVVTDQIWLNDNTLLGVAGTDSTADTSGAGTAQAWVVKSGVATTVSASAVRAAGVLAAGSYSALVTDTRGLITGMVGASYNVNTLKAAKVAGDAASTAVISLSIPATTSAATAALGTIATIVIDKTNDLTLTITNAAAIATYVYVNPTQTATTDSYRAGVATANKITATVLDQFGNPMVSSAVAGVITGRNAATVIPALLTDANGQVTYTLTDVYTGTLLLTDAIALTSGNGTGTVTINYAAYLPTATITMTTPDSAAATASGIAGVNTSDINAGDGAQATTAAVSVVLKDASGTVQPAGIPVVFTITGNTGAAVTSTKVTAYTTSLGVASTTVYSTLNGNATVTATAGALTASGVVYFKQADCTAGSACAEARTIAAKTTGNLVTATVTDRFGNPIKGVNVVATRVGTGTFNGTSSITGTTDKTGTVEFVLTNGTADVTVAFTSSTFGQSSATKGYLDAGITALTATVAGTTVLAAVGIGASSDAAGVNSVTVKAVTDTATLDASTAAGDAAAEATDAANAATDAANAAAEAADAATAAAQDAADAVAALSVQVSEMVNALKKQITALTNLVIKIQKKVKA